MTTSESDGITRPPSFSDQTKIQATHCCFCKRQVYLHDSNEWHQGLLAGRKAADGRIVCLDRRKCDEVCDALKAIDESERDLQPKDKATADSIDGLVCSNDSHCYHLIPEIAIRRLCERIALGEKTKGKDAWNALSENQQVLLSRPALARRIGHLINHAYHLLATIQNKEIWTEEDEKEASAVMWGGMFAICAIAAQRKAFENTNASS